MQQKLGAPHGFNHQSFYRQPVRNLRPINQIVWNNENNDPLMNSSSIHEEQNKNSNSKNVDRSHYQRLDLTSTNVTNTTHNQQQNVSAEMLNHRVTPILVHNITNLTKNQGNAEANNKQNVMYNAAARLRPESRRSRLDSQSTAVSGVSHNQRSLGTSRSAGVLYESIERERRAHTLAPSARILGPCATPTANMFASVVAPSDALMLKSSTIKQVDSTSQNVPGSNISAAVKKLSNEIQNAYNAPEMTDEDNDDNDDDEEDEQEDDSGPIIVKVRYNPETGGPPPEELIRQTLHQKMKARQNPNSTIDPIVLDFSSNLNSSMPTKLPFRSQQVPINRSGISKSQTVHRFPTNVLNGTYTQQQIQQSANLEDEALRNQRQEFLLRQQKQFEFQQRQRQIVFQQEKERLGLEKFLEQQKQRQMQERFLQQQKQIQYQQQQQNQLQLQQKKQLQIHQQQQKQLQYQQQQQQQQKLQYQQQQKELQKELQYQQQQQQQEKELQHKIQQQKFFQYQQQQQRLSRPVTKPSPQYDEQIINQRQALSQTRTSQGQTTMQQKQINAYLPPTVPRINPRTLVNRSSSTNRPAIMLVPNRSNYLSNNYSSIVNGTNRPRLVRDAPFLDSLPRIIKPGLAPSHSYAGLTSLSNYAPRYIPSMFIPISAGIPGADLSQANNKSYMIEQQNMAYSNRPNTAPGSSEMYRPSSALDIPELSKDNLNSLLSQIPDLRGRRFSIEYTDEGKNNSYPLPSNFTDLESKYPEASFVDELPKNIMQHVHASNNPSLLAALEPNLRIADRILGKEQVKVTSVSLPQASRQSRLNRFA